MIKFIKNNIVKILIILVVIYAGYQAAAYVNDLFFNKALKIIDDKYKADIQAMKDKIKIQQEKYKELSKKSAEERKEQAAESAAEIERIEKIYKTHKSKSAEELKKKNASISEILTEKKKDEITISEQKKTISALDQDISDVIERWAKADIEKDKKHNEIVAELERKYKRCNDYTETLKKEIKKTPFERILRVAVIGGAFYLGTKVK